MRKILPLVLALIGLGAGIGAGLMLRPKHDETVAINPCGKDAPETAVANKDKAGGPGGGDGAKATEFVKLNNQFIVPIVTGGGVEALVILSLSLEVKAGSSNAVYAMEPKLRDSFLQILFDHANAGGFAGAYTNSNNLDVLRAALLEAAKGSLGETVANVLITDIVRQNS